MKEKLAALAQTTWFRALLASFFLSLHLLAFAVHARSRFDLPFDSAPGAAPSIAQPARPSSPERWNRLVVSRWDAEHYINIALRGYEHCPATLRSKGELPSPPTMTCDLAFYPGYALVGRALSLGGRLPIDWAMFTASLAASWALLFFWTSRDVVGFLGLRATYVSLLCFNAFTTAFALVTIQTEPLVLGATLGAFVCAHRRRDWLAAVLAGAATGVRISGVATGLALIALLVARSIQERPAKKIYAIRAAQSAVAMWGVIATMGYHLIAFHSATLYMRAHQQSYGYEASVFDLFNPKAAWLLRSIDSPLHEGIWVVAVLLFLALGLRAALADAPRDEQAFWIVLTLAVLLVSMVGSVARAFVGMNRYALAALPIFFAMGKALERRRAALGLWVGLSLWHYWNVDMCFFIGDRTGLSERRCHAAICRSVEPDR
jgi:hypothetical protein